MVQQSPSLIEISGTPASVRAVLPRLVPAGSATTLVINGETSADPNWDDDQVRQALHAAIEVLATLPGPIIVSGGTNAGIFRLLGEVVARTEFFGPVIGVAPRGKIYRQHGTPLEPHHSHVLLVDGEAWGEELPAMITLSHTLAARGPIVTLIGGGGDHTRVEIAAHHQAGTPVILLRGTGRVTDEVAVHAQPGGSHVLDVHDHDRLRSVLMAILNPRQAASL
jgi:hypothetical protein